jgi:putative flippase GtrA
VGFGLFTFFIFVLPISEYLLALTLATILAGLNSYLMQRTFVWQSSANVKAEFIKFFTVFIGQFLANLILLYVLVDHFNFHPLWTQYVLGAVLILLTYISHKHWTFKAL